MPELFWTEERTQEAYTLALKLGVPRACEEMQRRYKQPVTRGGMSSAFSRSGLHIPKLTKVQKAERDGEKVLETTVVAGPVPGFQPVTPKPSNQPAQHTEPAYSIKRLIEATKHRPLSILEACDFLKCPPADLRALVEQAKLEHIDIQITENAVGTKPPNDRVQQVDNGVPKTGTPYTIGVISDTHLGSKYCLRTQLRDFIEYAYSKGAREILHPGDVLDGNYKHGIWEVSHMGLDEQADDLFQTLPQLPGLNYRCITGNHDHTFTLGSGVDVGSYLAARFAERGRNDLHFYGNRGAFLKVGGAVIHLWHPGSGGSYAKSYHLQKKIEAYGPGEKPHILLAGHWHQYCHVYERGVEAFACPTFQGGGSQFSKSLGNNTAIGGLVLTWELTNSGTMRRLSIDTRRYFEAELVHKV